MTANTDLLECGETLALLKVAFLVGDFQNYLFIQSLINAQWQEQYHRLIVNQLGRVMSLWDLVVDVQNRLTQSLPCQHFWGLSVPYTMFSLCFPSSMKNLGGNMEDEASSCDLLTNSVTKFKVNIYSARKCSN